MLKILTVMSALLVAGTASAQDAGWQYKATLYAWLPTLTTSTDTRFGTLNTSKSGSSVIKDLKAAFMGDFSAQNGKWGFVGDLLYADLGNTKKTPFNLFGDASVNMHLSALSGYALYRLSDDPRVKFDAGVGFRNFNLGLKVHLSAGLGPQGRNSFSQNFDKSWTDPLIAARLNVPFNDKWFLSGFADFGGTGGGNQTYQIYTGVGYNFDSAWSAQLGYRYMDIGQRIDGKKVKIGLSGALMAVSYSF
jgi:opacity protein-like surface antigen